MQKILSDETKDGVKLLFDAFKHMTTLSTGSILLIATFLRNIAYGEHSSLFAICSVSFFLLSILCSVIILILLPKIIGAAGQNQELTGKVYMRAAGVAAVSFFIGILSLGIFVILNIGGISNAT
ncbi:hypothetical protein JEU11_18900 [Paraglaciecola chathamensis]|jgi:hypothetical protein|uniref:Uncharacterized protein n=1 Tax=Paraglaciecola chathamensis TaxID=368405 RepID=A0ABS0WJD6_9ALTE|nr:hypothetical protein [Paraglaciecola chathamensis]MBJ2138528.1 hypothetical protein [Paraglaciecola chathamensis]|tara:strand:+ start:385 stop:756 length:372 start_codon:yes stop_codon:yes gene_type:complete